MRSRKLVLQLSRKLLEERLQDLFIFTTHLSEKDVVLEMSLNTDDTKEGIIPVTVTIEKEVRVLKHGKKLP